MTWKSKFELSTEDAQKIAPSTSKIFCKTEVVLADGYRNNSIVAKEFIPIGTIVMRDGGKLITSVADVPTEYKGYQVVFDENLYLSPSDSKPKSQFVI